MTDKLASYKSKREFKVTSEPAEEGKVGQGLSFIFN